MTGSDYFKNRPSRAREFTAPRTCSIITHVRAECRGEAVTGRVTDDKWVGDLLKMYSLGPEHPQSIPF